MSKTSHLKRIKEGDYLFFRSQTFFIKELDAQGILSLENIVTKEQVEKPLRDILVPKEVTSSDTQTLFASSLEELNAQIELYYPMPEVVNTNTLPENLIARAEKIVEIIETVEKLLEEDLRLARLRGKGNEFRRKPAIKRALSKLEKKIGLTQYYEYLKIYNQFEGSTSRIAASLRRSSYHQTTMSKVSLHLIDTMINRYYARPNALSKATLYAEIEKVLQRTQGQWADPAKCKGGVPIELVEELLDIKTPIEIILGNTEKAELLSTAEIPSKSWFYQYVNWFEAHPDFGRDIITKRYGKEEWEKTYMVFDTFVRLASVPLEYVVADHWLTDFFIVDEETRSEPYRLWLTVLIDVYTRCILGIALLPEHPCIESIQTALLHSIWPKTSHVELGIEDEWACYGIPHQLFLDNAWAHHSHSLETLAREISLKGRYDNITLIFRPPYLARYGGVIERFFGSISNKVKQLLPGAIKSSKPQHIGNAKEEASLIYDDVDRFLQKLIINYMHTYHSEIGMTPHEKWVQSVAKLGEPLVPPLTDKMKRHFLRLYPGTRRISNKGIELFGMDYWSGELNYAPRKDEKGKKIEYSIRYDPGDVSVICIYRDSDYICDVKSKDLRQPDGTTRSLSLAEREIAIELAKAKGKPAHKWLDQLSETDQLAKQRKTEKTKAKRQGSRVPKAPKSSPQVDVQTAQSALDATEKSYTDYSDYIRVFAKQTNNDMKRKSS